VCGLDLCLVGGRLGALHTAFYPGMWPGISCGSFGESGHEHLSLGLVASAHQAVSFLSCVDTALASAVAPLSASVVACSVACSLACFPGPGALKAAFPV